jgi:hypothetical protein
MVMASIFVQIPSYHDYELVRTIRDAINKSSGNHVIKFGVHISYYQKIDFDLPDIPNVKYELSLAPENIGVGISRYIANSFYDGEDYYFQIDSHSRFEQNWDHNLIMNYLKNKSSGANPVLSCYPGAYEYTDGTLNILNNKAHVSYTDFVPELSFLNDLIPHQRAVGNFSNNIFTKSVSAASIFSDGSIASVEPNKNIFFWGEEILTAIRLFTHGYDLMLPEAQNVYHLYYDADKGFKNLRRQTSVDFPSESNYLDKKSKLELERIITTKEVGAQALGSSRTLNEYESYANIDFSLKQIHT